MRKTVALVSGILILVFSGCYGVAGSHSSQSASIAEDSVWVTRPDGAKQCDGPGQELDAGASELIKSGIAVIEQRKTTDSNAHVQMCGAAANTENSYKIHRSDLARAKTLGFHE